MAQMKNLFKTLFGGLDIRQFYDINAGEYRTVDKDGNEIRFCDVCRVWHMDGPIHKGNCQKVAQPVEVIPDESVEAELQSNPES